MLKAQALSPRAVHVGVSVHKVHRDRAMRLCRDPSPVQAFPHFLVGVVPGMDQSPEVHLSFSEKN